MDFKAKRFVSEFSHEATGTPEKIFPLLCPVRERDWIPGWHATMIYSDSGLVENDAVFEHPTPDRGPATYVVTRRDNIQWIVEFVIFIPELTVEKLEVSLHPGKGKPAVQVHWKRVFTALSTAGNHWIESLAQDHFATKMKTLSDSLNRYCLDIPCTN